MSSVTSKSIILIAPFDEGVPGPEHFRIEEKAVDLDVWKSRLAEDNIIVQVLVISPDPFLRSRMRTQGGFGANTVVSGFVAGKILSSKNPKWQENDIFGAALPFTTYQIVSKGMLNAIPMWKLTEYIDESQISVGIGALGMPGSTAYAGLLDILRPNQGETVFVSAASGAVGGLVGTLSKELFNCKVIGSCGGEAKGKIIKEKFSYDHAIDYKKANTAEDLVTALKEVAPEGIDMYFENVGGIHFDAAFEVLRPKGRIAVCGAISEYNNAAPPSFVVKNAGKLIYHNIRIEGFTCSDWLAGKRGNFIQDMGKLWKEGKLPIQETVFNGIESWPEAFQSLFTGANLGKVVVKV